MIMTLSYTAESTWRSIMPEIPQGVLCNSSEQAECAGGRQIPYWGTPGRSRNLFFLQVPDQTAWVDFPPNNSAWNTYHRYRPPELKFPPACVPPQRGRSESPAKQGAGSLFGWRSPPWFAHVLWSKLPPQSCQRGSCFPLCWCSRLEHNK